MSGRSEGRALALLQQEITGCGRCPRLRAWCAEVAATRRRAYAGEVYWGRPVPGFGDPEARLVLVGLAPGAHGANRTGRMFTGDRSGEFLFAALHRAGYASSPASRGRDDGLQLRDCWITAAVRCAPPDNKPTAQEFDLCRPHLERELALLPKARVFLTLGRLAHEQLLRAWGQKGCDFAHGAEWHGGERGRLVACYHPSQQNTFTGRLTAAMMDRILERARELTAD